MRIATLATLCLIAIILTTPANANTNNNQLYTDGMANGRMWSSVDHLGEKQSRFFKTGFVNGFSSGRAEVALEIGASDLNQETMNQVLTVITGGPESTVGDYIKYFDVFYSDSENLDIPMAFAFYCIKKLALGNKEEYEFLVNESRKNYSR